jgi:hypothetical protein
MRTAGFIPLPTKSGSTIFVPFGSKRPDPPGTQTAGWSKVQLPPPTVLSASCCNDIVEHLEAGTRRICVRY